MTKTEAIAYLKRLKKSDDDMLASADGVLPATKQDKEDELGRMDTFREFSRNKQTNNLTSDEK